MNPRTLALSAALAGAVACGGATVTNDEAATGTDATAPTAGAQDGEGPRGHGAHDGDGPHGHGAQDGDGPHGHGAHNHAAGHHHRFENPEEYAERWNSDERDAWQRPDLVLDVAGVEPGMTVADLGAGTGYFVPHLSLAVGGEGRVLALDAEPAMVAYLEDRAAGEGWSNVEIRHVPFESAQLEPASVDRIFIVNTWHHIESRPTYGRELFEALRPGGELVIIDFTMSAPHGPPPAMRLSVDTVIGELMEIGFDAEEREAGLTRQYVVAGTRPDAD